MKFAALCRVSTQNQASQGESLETQKKYLLQCVDDLGGETVEIYSGHESAMGTTEREIFEKLKRDIVQGKINSVIVADASRLFRRQNDLMDFIKVSTTYKAKFYSGTRVVDLNDPEQLFMLGVMTSASEFNINQSTRKSILNKIARAKKGFPSNGTPPFGRFVINKKSNTENAIWAVDQDKKELVRKLYDYYVNKEYDYRMLADKFGVEKSQARRLLVECSSSNWKISFKHKDIKETVMIKVPPLLSDDEIALVKAVSATRRQFRPSERIYPLAHVVRCVVCGETFSGSSDHKSGVRRYFHRHPQDGRKIVGKCMNTIQAKWLEDAVFSHIGAILKDDKEMRKAVEQVQALSNAELNNFRERLDTLKENEIKLLAKREKLVSFASDGIFTQQEIVGQLSDIRNQLSPIEEEIIKVTQNMDRLVSVGDKRLVEQAEGLVFALQGMGGRMPMLWAFEDDHDEGLKLQKSLAEFFFGMARNKSLGVFVGVQGKFPNQIFDYQVRGLIGTAEGEIKPFRNSKGKRQAEMGEGWEDFFKIESKPDYATLIKDITGNFLPNLGKYVRKPDLNMKLCRS